MNFQTNVQMNNIKNLRDKNMQWDVVTTDLNNELFHNAHNKKLDDKNEKMVGKENELRWVAQLGIGWCLQSNDKDQAGCGAK